MRGMSHRLLLCYLFLTRLATVAIYEVNCHTAVFARISYRTPMRFVFDGEKWLKEEDMQAVTNQFFLHGSVILYWGLQVTSCTYQRNPR